MVKSQRQYRGQSHKGITAGKDTKTLQREKSQRHYNGKSHKDSTEGKVTKTLQRASYKDITVGKVAAKLQRGQSQRHCRSQTRKGIAEGKLTKTLQKAKLLRQYRRETNEPTRHKSELLKFGLFCLFIASVQSFRRISSLPQQGVQFLK